MHRATIQRSRQARTELLAVASPDELGHVADALLQQLGTPMVTSPPETGLVVLQVREPVCRDRFHLGEVVVSRAEVLWHGSAGWSMRLGTDRASAVAAALCDAAAELDDGRDQVAELCDRVASRVASAEQREWATLAATRVRFEELD